MEPFAQGGGVYLLLFTCFNDAFLFIAEYSLYATNATICLSLHLLIDIWVVFLLFGCYE